MQPLHDTFKHARILLADDETFGLMLFQDLLKGEGYQNVTATDDAREVVKLYLETDPDLVILDFHMPHKDGLEVMHDLLALGRSHPPPVLILTADGGTEVKRRALAVGAKDFLSKPCDTVEFGLRVHNLLETHFLTRQLAQHNESLEVKVQERTLALEEAQLETIARLAVAAEFRDDVTGQHVRRVGRLSAHIAQTLGLPTHHVTLLKQAAPLHDVGKIAIPDSILLKPGKLTPEEYETVKGHTLLGAKMLTQGRSAVMQMAERVALYHHERFDGGGYPHGLARDAIPIEGRIVAVADVYDALAYPRPYKEAWAQPENEIFRHSGSQFDPEVVRAFRAVLEAHDIGKRKHELVSI